MHSYWSVEAWRKLRSEFQTNNYKKAGLPLNILSKVRYTFTTILALVCYLIVLFPYLFVCYSSIIVCYSSTVNPPPHRQPSGRVLASSAGGPGIIPLSRTASYQRRYKNGTSSSLVQHSTLKREILALSQELR